MQVEPCLSAQVVRLSRLIHHHGVMSSEIPLTCCTIPSLQPSAVRTLREGTLGEEILYAIILDTDQRMASLAYRVRTLNLKPSPHRVF